MLSPKSDYTFKLGENDIISVVYRKKNQTIYLLHFSIDNSVLRFVALHAETYKSSFYFNYKNKSFYAYTTMHGSIQNNEVYSTLYL